MWEENSGFSLSKADLYNRIMWMYVMSHTNEISQDCSKTMDAYHYGKDYKSRSKEFDSTSPLSGKLCTNGDNSMLLLSSSGIQPGSPTERHVIFWQV